MVPAAPGEGLGEPAGKLLTPAMLPEISRLCQFVRFVEKPVRQGRLRLFDSQNKHGSAPE